MTTAEHMDVGRAHLSADQARMVHKTLERALAKFASLGFQKPPAWSEVIVRWEQAETSIAVGGVCILPGALAEDGVRHLASEHDNTGADIDESFVRFVHSRFIPEARALLNEWGKGREPSPEEVELVAAVRASLHTPWWNDRVLGRIASDIVERHNARTTARVQVDIADAKRAEVLVYLCGAHEDRQQTEMIREALDDEGLAVWSHHDIAAGDHALREREGAISRACCFVFLVSERGLRSSGSALIEQRSIALSDRVARRHGGRHPVVFPVVLGELPEVSIPAFLGAYRAVRLRGDDGDRAEVERLVHRINAVHQEWVGVSDAHRLVDVLATVINVDSLARIVVIRGGFPSKLIPAWTTALGFWTQILDLARNGVCDGDRSIVAAAVEVFPHNPEIERFLQR